MSSHAKTIACPGIVCDLPANSVMVKVDCLPACHGCQAAGRCLPSSQTQKILKIDRGQDSFSVGQPVLVVMNEQQGLEAAFLAYVLPFFIMISMLTCCIYIGLEEWMAAVAALVTLGFYYGGLFFFRGKFRKHFDLRIQS